MIQQKAFLKIISNNNQKMKRTYEKNIDTYRLTSLFRYNQLGPSTLEISKIVMHEFWYEYMKPKYGEKNKAMLHG